MNRSWLTFLALYFFLLLLSACSAPGKVPIEERTVPATGTTQPSKDPDSAAQKEAAQTMPTNQAVVALLDESKSQLNKDNQSNAIRSVERALRLEPKNPYLWHQYALIRAREGNWQQVLFLAQKSYSLSAADTDLQQENKKLMTTARQKLNK